MLLSVYFAVYVPFDINKVNKFGKFISTFKNLKNENRELFDLILTKAHICGHDR